MLFYTNVLLLLQPSVLWLSIATFNNDAMSHRQNEFCANFMYSEFDPGWEGYTTLKRLHGQIWPRLRGFLQAGRYATKGEKPLRATICLSIEHAYPRDAYVKTSNDITSSCFAGNIRYLNIQRQDGNENVSKTIGLISKTTLHVHHAFLCISLPFLHDYDVKMPNFAFYG